MRVVVWFLACAFIACGKSERHRDVPGHGVAGNAASTMGSGGSAAASSGSGGIGTGGSVSGGAPASAMGGAGGVSSTGAGQGDAGGQRSTGGATSGGGGAGISASAGEGGSSGDTATNSAGAAGAAPECAGEYDACGCGCCGGTTPNTVCYYPDRGDSLDTIRGADQTVAQSPDCAAAGCAIGMHYVCCAPPSEEPPAMSYSVTGGMITSDIYRVTLYRTGTDERCQVAHFARGDGPGGKAFPIAMPDGWILELLEDFLCADASSQMASKRRDAIGATGQLGFSSTSGQCSVKFDFTAFFASESGGVDAVQFVSDWQEAPVVPECG